MTIFVKLAMEALLSVLTPEKIKGFIQTGIQRIQDYVAKTENKLDDSLIPATNLVLAALEIPGPNGEIDVSAELNKLFALLGNTKDIFIDAGLDWIENKVIESPMQFDDLTVLPMCSLVRKVLNVPDNDD